MLINDNVIDLMREFSPKPTEETLFANAIETSAVRAVPNRLREKTKSAVRMPQRQIINTVAVAFLIVSSACANPPGDTEGVKVTIVKPSDGVTARIIPAESTSIPTPREITADFQSQLLPFTMKIPFDWKNYEGKDNLDWKNKRDTLGIETSFFYVVEDNARVVGGLTPKSGAINIAIRRIDVYVAKINLSPEGIKNKLIADGNKSYLGQNGKTFTDKTIENDEREWIVDGHKAIRIDAEMMDEEGVILRKGEVYIFEDDNRNVWQIAFGADSNAFEKESAKFRNSLATFHLQEEQA